MQEPMQKRRQSPRKTQNREWKRNLKKIRKALKQELKQKTKSRKPEKNREKTEPARKENSQNEQYDLPFTRASREIPFKEIRDGIIYTADGRYVKILEVMPINFLHRSASEQRGIIYSFMGYLKIAPPELQIKSLSKKQIFPSILRPYGRISKRSRTSGAGCCSRIMRI